jgi:RNA polymerase sigma-70 factor (ECF subfamily)
MIPGALTRALPVKTSQAETLAPAPSLALDEAGFEVFHARTSRPLWAYLRRIGGGPEAADDALQEAYLRFLTHPPTPESDERTRKAYLYRIATNLVRDRWRHNERERLGLDRFLVHLASRSGSRDADARLDFGEAFHQLPSRERALLWLAHVEGYEHREIAGILGLKETSIRVLLFRARQRLAQIMKKEETGR